jgi:hypothetical protein
VIDLATAERLRLERQGATHEAGLRLATALFPSSMTAAISLGNVFLTAARQAIETAPGGSNTAHGRPPIPYPT